MNRHPQGSPVDPPFGCSGPRLVGETVKTIVRDLGVPEAPDRRPRYFAEGPFVIVTATRRRMTLEAAWEESVRLLGSAVDYQKASLADAYFDELSDLINAMREAKGNQPTPPAQAMRSAA